MSQQPKDSKAPAAAKAKKSSGGGSFSTIFAVLLIPLALIVAFWAFYNVLGNPANFEGGDPDGAPLPGNYLGMMYKGGLMVAILMSCFIIAVGVIFERLFTIFAARGKGNVSTFVRNVKGLLDQGKVDEAVAACDKQRGSVGNVLRESLLKYKEVENDDSMDRDQKVAAVQKAVEEATSLELPVLEKNLVIVSTLASVATLLGLLGTVTGMIRAFSALATAGAPDAVALSAGISEALINTALGIGTSAICVIMYNVFTTRIDKMTYAIDEAAFSFAQNLMAKK